MASNWPENQSSSRFNTNRAYSDPFRSDFEANDDDFFSDSKSTPQAFYCSHPHVNHSTRPSNIPQNRPASIAMNPTRIEPISSDLFRSPATSKASSSLPSSYNQSNSNNKSNKTSLSYSNEDNDDFDDWGSDFSVPPLPESKPSISSSHKPHLSSNPHQTGFGSSKSTKDMLLDLKMSDEESEDLNFEADELKANGEGFSFSDDESFDLPQSISLQKPKVTKIDNLNVGNASQGFNKPNQSFNNVANQSNLSAPGMPSNLSNQPKRSIGIPSSNIQANQSDRVAPRTSTTASQVVSQTPSKPAQTPSKPIQNPQNQPQTPVQTPTSRNIASHQVTPVAKQPPKTPAINSTPLSTKSPSTLVRLHTPSSSIKLPSMPSLTRSTPQAQPKQAQQVLPSNQQSQIAQRPNQLQQANQQLQTAQRPNQLQQSNQQLQTAQRPNQLQQPNQQANQQPQTAQRPNQIQQPQRAPQSNQQPQLSSVESAQNPVQHIRTIPSSNQPNQPNINNSSNIINGNNSIVSSQPKRLTESGKPIPLSRTNKPTQDHSNLPHSALPANQPVIHSTSQPFKAEHNHNLNGQQLESRVEAPKPNTIQNATQPTQADIIIGKPASKPVQPTELREKKPTSQVEGSFTPAVVKPIFAVPVQADPSSLFSDLPEGSNDFGDWDSFDSPLDSFSPLKSNKTESVPQQKQSVPQQTQSLPQQTQLVPQQVGKTGLLSSSDLFGKDELDDQPLDFSSPLTEAPNNQSIITNEATNNDIAIKSEVPVASNDVASDGFDSDWGDDTEEDQSIHRTPQPSKESSQATTQPHIEPTVTTDKEDGFDLDWGDDEAEETQENQVSKSPVITPSDDIPENPSENHDSIKETHEIQKVSEAVEASHDSETAVKLEEEQIQREPLQSHPPALNDDDFDMDWGNDDDDHVSENTIEKDGVFGQVQVNQTRLEPATVNEPPKPAFVPSEQPKPKPQTITEPSGVQEIKSDASANPDVKRNQESKQERVLRAPSRATIPFIPPSLKHATPPTIDQPPQTTFSPPSVSVAPVPHPSKVSVPTFHPTTPTQTGVFVPSLTQPSPQQPQQHSIQPTPFNPPQTVTNQPPPRSSRPAKPAATVNLPQPQFSSPDIQSIHPTPSSVPSATSMKTPHKHASGPMTIEDMKRPRAIASFGFGGLLVLSFPKPNSFGTSFYSPQSSCINIRQTSKLLADNPEVIAMKSFPGPVLSKSTKEISNFLNSRCKHADQPTTTTGPLVKSEASRMLWHFLKQMIATKGIVQGPKGCEKEIQKMLLADSVPDPATVLPPTGMTPTTTPETIHQALIKIQALVQEGKREEAVQTAIDASMWDHALLLSSFVSPSVHRDTLASFAVACLPAGSPLRTTYLQLGGKPQDFFKLPPSAALLPTRAPVIGLPVPSSGITTFQPQNPLESSQLSDPYNLVSSNWRANVAAVLANSAPQMPTRPTSNGPAQTQANWPLITLGDSFWSNISSVEAAHLCYLLAEAKMDSITDPGSRLVLIGGDHKRQPRTLLNNVESIHKTELFEFAKRLAVPGFNIPSLQVYKLIYASSLTDLGLMKQAIEYLDSIKTIVAENKNNQNAFTPAFLSKLADLYARIKLLDVNEVTSQMNAANAQGGSGWFGSFLKTAVEKIIGDDEPAVGSVPAGNPKMPAATNIPAPGIAKAPVLTPNLPHHPMMNGSNNMPVLSNPAAIKQPLELSSTPVSVPKFPLPNIGGQNKRVPGVPPSTPGAPLQTGKSVHTPTQAPQTVVLTNNQPVVSGPIPSFPLPSIRSKPKPSTSTKPLNSVPPQSKLTPESQPKQLDSTVAKESPAPLSEYPTPNTSQLNKEAAIVSEPIKQLPTRDLAQEAADEAELFEGSWDFVPAAPQASQTEIEDKVEPSIDPFEEDEAKDFVAPEMPDEVQKDEQFDMVVSHPSESIESDKLDESLTKSSEEQDTISSPAPVAHETQPLSVPTPEEEPQTTSINSSALVSNTEPAAIPSNTTSATPTESSDTVKPTEHPTEVPTEVPTERQTERPEVATPQRRVSLLPPKKTPASKPSTKVSSPNLSAPAKSPNGLEAPEGLPPLEALETKPLKPVAPTSNVPPSTQQKRADRMNKSISSSSIPRQETTLSQPKKQTDDDEAHSDDEKAQEKVFAAAKRQIEAEDQILLGATPTIEDPSKISRHSHSAPPPSKSKDESETKSKTTKDKKKKPANLPKPASNITAPTFTTTDPLLSTPTRDIVDRSSDLLQTPDQTKPNKSSEAPKTEPKRSRFAWINPRNWFPKTPQQSSEPKPKEVKLGGSLKDGPLYHHPELGWVERGKEDEARKRNTFEPPPKSDKKAKQAESRQELGLETPQNRGTFSRTSAGLSNKEDEPSTPFVARSDSSSSAISSAPRSSRGRRYVGVSGDVIVPSKSTNPSQLNLLTPTATPLVPNVFVPQPELSGEQEATSNTDDSTQQASEPSEPVQIVKQRKPKPKPTDKSKKNPNASDESDREDIINAEPATLTASFPVEEDSSNEAPPSVTKTRAERKMEREQLKAKSTQAVNARSPASQPLAKPSIAKSPFGLFRPSTVSFSPISAPINSDADKQSNSTLQQDKNTESISSNTFDEADSNHTADPESFEDTKTNDSLVNNTSYVESVVTDSSPVRPVEAAEPTAGSTSLLPSKSTKPSRSVKPAPSTRKSSKTPLDTAFVPQIEPEPQPEPEQSSSVVEETEPKPQLVAQPFAATALPSIGLPQPGRARGVAKASRPKSAASRIQLAFTPSPPAPQE